MGRGLLLQRSPRNPILTPTDRWWETRLTCNAGAVKLGEYVHLLYTARGQDDIARIGYARLRGYDEVEERLPYPVLAPEEWFERDGVEDPRIIALDGRIYVIYAGKERDMARPCEVSLSPEELMRKEWAWTKHRLLLPTMVGFHNRNAAYFPRRIGERYALLHRPMTLAEHIWLSYSYDLVHWYDHQQILTPRPGYWDDAKVGIAGPPIELDHAWLLIYHGVEARTWTYRLGYVLLDKERPHVVLERSVDPILEPEEDYERVGVAPNVVFSCGSVLDGRTLVLYYGAADRVLCVAWGELPW
jgi:predicted GH43/DUF377 family glycosyl hydrolase